VEDVGRSRGRRGRGEVVERLRRSQGSWRGKQGSVQIFVLNVFV
jgi:hypothetical protein